MIVWHGVVNAFLTPPGLFLLPAALGLALCFLWPRLGGAIVVLSWAGLTLLSLPVVSAALARGWEVYPALTHPLPSGRQAIVVLAAGRYRKAPEYGGHDTVGPDTLFRVRYAARLYHETRLPILVSGGAPLGGTPAAVLMDHVLLRDFRVPVTWIEGRSKTTAQNAADSAKILAPLHIRRIFLVTQAWHMRRAVLLFRRAGFIVTAAPTGFVAHGRRSHSLLAYLPSAHALAISAVIFHEMIGLAWVRLEPQLPRFIAHTISRG